MVLVSLNKNKMVDKWQEEGNTDKAKWEPNLGEEFCLIH